MPNRSELHVDKLLSEISIKYKNTEYIAEQVFPVLKVKKSSDLYRIYDRNFRIPETARANGGVAREHTHHYTNGSYVLRRNSLKDYISTDDMDNFDAGDLRADVVEELSETIARRMEYDVAQLFTSTTWTNNVSLAAGFNSNTLTTNPIAIFDTAATTVIQNSGFKPNIGILPRDGYIACKAHVSVLDRVKYTSAEISENIMAKLFDLEKLLVPVSQYDSSALGVTEAITAIWPNHAWVGYRPATPSPKKPSAGYIFVKDRAPVRRWFDEERDSEVIEVDKSYRAVCTSAYAGYLIKDIT